MPASVFARSVSAFGHSYTLDFTSVVIGSGLFLLLLCIAALGLRTLSPHADRQNIGRSIGWGSILTAWFLGKYYYLGLPVEMFSLPSHVYHLFRTHISLTLLWYGLASWLAISTMIGFLLVIPSALRTKPLFEQAEALWKRVYWLLPLLVLFGIASLCGVSALSGIGKIGCVPSFELPKHPAVQVGNPFRARPQEGRYVGAVHHHWFGLASTPAIAGENEFTKEWSYPGQPLVAQKVGLNRFTLLMQHTGTTPFFIETPFQVEAEEERGNPDFPLQVGNEWRYRLAVTATEEEFLQQARNHEPRPVESRTETAPATNPNQLITIRVERADIYDGVQQFTLSVHSPMERKEKERTKTFSASMWGGQTYVGWREEDRKPLIEKRGVPIPDAEHGERPYPCQLTILPRPGTCLCSETAMDDTRKLPGLLRCWQNKSQSTDWFTLPLLLMTGGLSLAAPALRPTQDREYTVGIWLESSNGSTGAPAGPDHSAPRKP